MISAVDYKYIADAVNQIIIMEKYSITSIDTLISDLAVLEDPAIWGNDLGLLDLLSMTNLNNLSSSLFTQLADRFNNGYSVATIIIGMQNDVLTNYGDINLFLSVNIIKVKTDFANLSGQLGFTIDSSNIEV